MITPLGNQIYSVWNSFVAQVVFFAPRLLFGVFIFLLFFVVAIFFQKITVKACKKAGRHIAICLLLSKLLKLAVIIVGAITALGTMGINVTALVASLGLFGFAAGFALKDLLSNILAGVMILLYRPFTAGDKIAGGNFQGMVREINLRYVVLEAEDGSVLVPNSVILNNVINLKK